MRNFLNLILHAARFEALRSLFEAFGLFKFLALQLFAVAVSVIATLMGLDWYWAFTGLFLVFVVISIVIAFVAFQIGKSLGKPEVITKPSETNVHLHLYEPQKVDDLVAAIHQVANPLSTAQTTTEAADVFDNQIGEQPSFFASEPEQKILKTDEFQKIVFTREIRDSECSFDCGKGVFTTSVAGYFLFHLSINFAAWDKKSDGYLVRIVTSNRNFVTRFSVEYMEASLPLLISVPADMDAGDTAYCEIKQVGGERITELGSDSYFAGALS